MADPGVPDLMDGDAVIAILVGQALDDLEAGRVDVPTALRLVATGAWRECERTVREQTG